MKNANIRSIEELERRLREGEVFYFCRTKIFYDFDKCLVGESPYRCDDKALKDYWCYFLQFTIKLKWEDSLKKQQIPCWVSNNNSEERKGVRMIREHFSAHYLDSDKGSWTYATPIKIYNCWNEDE